MRGPNRSCQQSNKHRISAYLSWKLSEKYYNIIAGHWSSQKLPRLFPSLSICHVLLAPISLVNPFLKLIYSQFLSKYTQTFAIYVSYQCESLNNGKKTTLGIEKDRYVFYKQSAFLKLLMEFKPE